MQPPPQVQPSYDEWLAQMKLRGYEASANPAFFRETYEKGKTPDEFARMIEDHRKGRTATAAKQESRTSYLLLLVAIVGICGYGAYSNGLLGNIGFNIGGSTASASKVSQGMTYEDVRSALGEPQRVQNLNNSVNVGNETITSDMQMWYYNGASLQIVFDGGKVTGINQY